MLINISALMKGIARRSLKVFAVFESCLLVFETVRVSTIESSDLCRSKLRKYPNSGLKFSSSCLKSFQSKRFGLFSVLPRSRDSGTLSGFVVVESIVVGSSIDSTNSEQINRFYLARNLRIVESYLPRFKV